MNRRACLIPVLAAAALGVLVLGCSRSLDPVSPRNGVGLDAGEVPYLVSAPSTDLGSGGADVVAKNLFYPLALGNRWHYRGVMRMQIVPADQPPGDPLVVESDILRTLVCIESRNSLDYTVERGVTDDGSGPFASWIRYRQDRRGLYEADVAGSVPPPCDPGPLPLTSARRAGVAEGSDHAGEVLASRLAGLAPARARAVLAAWADLRQRLDMVRHPAAAGAAAHGRKGGVLPGEITRLGYPLHPGARWVIRDDPRFICTVEAVDPVVVQGHKVVAYRLRIDSGLFGPRDLVHTWVSRIGFVQLKAHLEGAVVSEDGVPTGDTIVAEQTETLLDFLLVGKGHKPASGPEPAEEELARD